MTEAPSVLGQRRWCGLDNTCGRGEQASIATVVSTAVVATGPPSTASPLDEIDRKIKIRQRLRLPKNDRKSAGYLCGLVSRTRLGTPPLESLEALISTFPPMYRCRFLVVHDAGSPVDARSTNKKFIVFESSGSSTTRSTHHGTHQLNTGIAPNCSFAVSSSVHHVRSNSSMARLTICDHLTRITAQRVQLQAPSKSF